jgi:hypothetical protein
MRPQAFELGDKLYLTTPLLLATPSVQQVDEYAFASAVKSQAPNENIGWLSGKYVEGGKPNLNGAMWLNDELALKSLTPMLMPVTVMHDPRTAVGVIADCKLISEGSNRIDNILAVWRHRFSEVWAEAEHNLGQGTLAESMECYAPNYDCSSCGQQYVKLPNGAEKAAWCEHLRADASSPSRGWRILRDVCFTGTGLIFGTRGGLPAYSEATLDYFQNEIAEAHDKSHHDGTYRPTNRSASHMALVQIEESELTALRAERTAALAAVETAKDEKRELTGKVEKAEAEKVAAETAKTAAETKVATLETAAQAVSLKDKRLSTLGAGFLAKLGETSKANLNELAGTASDDAWDKALIEREEYASGAVPGSVKRDFAGEPGAAPVAPGVTPPAAPAGTTFADDEVAAFVRGGVATQGAAPVPDGASSVGKIARSLGKKTPAPAGAAK